MRKEAQAFATVRGSLRINPSPNGTVINGEGLNGRPVDAARLVFDKVCAFCMRGKQEFYCLVTYLRHLSGLDRSFTLTSEIS